MWLAVRERGVSRYRWFGRLGGGRRTDACQDDDVAGSLLPHCREGGFYYVDGAEEVGFELGAD